MSIYFDHNATTPRHPSVVEEMLRAERECWANPSSVHAAGRRARRAMEDVREQLAKLLSRSPRDVILTGGGTEANHLALSGARWLVTSRIEHPSIVAQAEELASRGTRVVFADVDADGVVSPQSIDAALSEALDGRVHEAADPALGGLNNTNTPLVALMAANHETGVIQPLAEVKEVARSWGARLHVDAVQWLGKAELSPLLVADSLSLAAHKFRGPKGIGALVFDCGYVPLPLGRGGAQERGIRPGTIDATAVVGMGAALRRLDSAVAALDGVSRQLRQLEQSLCQRGPDGTRVHGAGVPRLGHVLNFSVPGWRGDELVAALDLEGICVSSGSACSAGTAEPSAVIRAMLGVEAAAGAVRISAGEETSSLELEALTRALTKLGILARAP